MMKGYKYDGGISLASHFVFLSHLSTLKNKELSPVIGQKGFQATLSSGSQSEHSPHTVRRGKMSSLMPLIGHGAVLCRCALLTHHYHWLQRISDPPRVTARRHPEVALI